MKDLVKQYLDGGMSRRQFLAGLGGVGITAAAADAMANSLTPFQLPEAAPDVTRPWMRQMSGTGGRCSSRR